ncbi:MAG: hypothetical protein Kow0065_15450 [Methylomicrobium sp.]
MLFAQIAGIVMTVWFYQTATKLGENPMKWAITGLIGYWLTWWIVKLTIKMFNIDTMVGSSVVLKIIVISMPAIAAILATWYVRKKFLVDAAESKTENQ